ncbi:DUF5074 domain-containing protein [Paraprevotella xylaniphila]
MKWCKWAIMALALGCFTACSEDDDTVGDGGKPGEETGGNGGGANGSDSTAVPSPVVALGAYVLNTGNWGGNDASIQYLDFQTGKLSEDLYAAANGEGLGDLGQDLCVYGSKIYVTVSGSSKVVIMDRKCKVLKSIPVATEDGTPVEPRYMAACEGKVYFTAYDGTVSRIDTTSMAIDGKLNLIDAGAQTGYDHPEAITSANGKLYVNISGYSKGKWLAVVDAASFTKLKDIEVMLNPYTQCITAEDGYVYFVSNGNYAGSPSLTSDQYIYGTMQRLDPETDQVEQVCRATYIANAGEKMYILYSEYYMPDVARAYVRDLKTGDEQEFMDMADLQSANGLAVDPASGDVYVFDVPYGAASDVHVYGADGTYKRTFEAGMSTSKMVFVTK